MANLCDYDMRIVGKKKNIQKFINALTQTGTIWMGRGAEANVTYEDTDGNDCVATVFGYCKWSIVSSLIDNAKSMRKTPENWSFGSDDKVLTFITLDEASKIYNVDVEVYSEEPGCEFQEHYLIQKGKFIKDECVHYEEYFKGDFETKEDFEKEHDITISDEIWNDGEDYYSVGGFKNWDFSI